MPLQLTERRSLGARECLLCQRSTVRYGSLAVVGLTGRCRPRPDIRRKGTASGLESSDHALWPGRPKISTSRLLNDGKRNATNAGSRSS